MFWIEASGLPPSQWAVVAGRALGYLKGVLGIGIFAPMDARPSQELHPTPRPPRCWVEVGLYSHLRACAAARVSGTWPAGEAEGREAAHNNQVNSPEAKQTRLSS